MILHVATNHMIRPLQDGLVVSMSASHAAGRGFAPQLGLTKDHHKNGIHI